MTVSNDLHPLNKELISFNEDELKDEKSIDIIFSTFLSYSKSKKWAKLSTDEFNAIIIQDEDFISKRFLDKLNKPFSIKAPVTLFLYSLISSFSL